MTDLTPEDEERLKSAGGLCHSSMAELDMIRSGRSRRIFTPGGLPASRPRVDRETKAMLLTVVVLVAIFFVIESCHF